MSEELLKTIIKLFAIVAKERITEAERNKISDFLSLHLNREAVGYYLSLFDSFVQEREMAIKVDESENKVDDLTLEFVNEWNQIIKISNEVNKALTITQKLVILVNIIELIYIEKKLSERQSNLIFYITQALKIPQKYVNSLQRLTKVEAPEQISSQDTLVIRDRKDSPKLKVPELNCTGLDGAIFILRIPQLELFFIKYVGNSSLTNNSVPLLPNKVEVFSTGSTIRGNTTPNIYYSDIMSRFLKVGNKQAITFTADHLFYHFKSGKAGLQNINIAESGGKLIGIMGASGSGKSTLMNVLNGTEIPSSGRVIINGINIHEQPKEVEGMIGFVPQDDFLIAELTVFENLYYAARLCFGNQTDKENRKLVEEVLSSLGLLEIAFLKVGSPMDKTISGGQRKRINIGMELLREPAVFFVDEPTSGLSSRDSENIMDLLKELSYRGKMVFVVIHQPSSDIFKLFDSLIILDSGGFQIYYGNPVESVQYFKNLINVANKNESLCPECGNINPEQVFSIIETRIVNEFGRLTSTRRVSPDQWYQYFREYIKIPKVAHPDEKYKVVQSIPGRIRQFFTFLKRDVKAKLQNTQYILINLIQAPVLALFIGFMIRYYPSINEGEMSYTYANNVNIPVYFFMSIIVALFLGLTVSAEEIFKDRLLLKRERFLHLSRLSYLNSKIAVLFIISVFQTLSYVIVGNFVLGLEGWHLGFWLTLLSTSFFANMLGLNISASFNSAVTIYIIIPLMLIPQLLLSGVVIRFDKFNPAVTNVENVPIFGDLMASRWAFEGIMVTEYVDNPYMHKVYAVEKNLADNTYKAMYYLPRIETEVAKAFNRFSSKTDKFGEGQKRSLDIIKTGLASEYQLVDKPIPSWLMNIEPNNYNLALHDSIKRSVQVFKTLYSNRLNAAEDEKRNLFQEFIDQGLDLDSLRKIYINEEVEELVKNTRTLNRTLLLNGDIKRKIYPIFDTSHLRNPSSLSYRTDFYAPKKLFAGWPVDTLWFNILVIWLMSFSLFLTLYFNLLKRFIRSFEKRQKRRKRQKRFI